MPETPPHCFIGIDPAPETFAISLFRQPNQTQPTTTFANDFEGFSACRTWLSEHKAIPEAPVICVEATGVYAEALCYFLDEQGYRISVESPQQVKRAFKTTNKNDPTDARQIVGDRRRSPNMPTAMKTNSLYGSPKRLLSNRFGSY